MRSPLEPGGQGVVGLHRPGKFVQNRHRRPIPNESAHGPEDIQPVVGMRPRFHDAFTLPEIEFMYYGIVFGDTPGDAILDYWRDAADRPENAAPVDGLGDEAWSWAGEDGASLNASVLRGNVTLSANMLVEDTPENRARLESLARLVLERLFERGSQTLP